MILQFVPELGRPQFAGRTVYRLGLLPGQLQQDAGGGIACLLDDEQELPQFAQLADDICDATVS